MLQTNRCKCSGWKNPNPAPTAPRTDPVQPLASMTDQCKTCKHELGKRFTMNSQHYPNMHGTNSTLPLYEQKVCGY